MEEVVVKEEVPDPKNATGTDHSHFILDPQIYEEDRSIQEADLKVDVNPTAKEKVSKRKGNAMKKTKSMKLPVVVPIEAMNRIVRKRRKNTRPRRKAPTENYDEDDAGVIEKHEVIGDASNGNLAHVMVERDKSSETLDENIMADKPKTDLTECLDKIDEKEVTCKKTAVNRKRTNKKKNAEKRSEENKVQTAKFSKRGRLLKTNRKDALDEQNEDLEKELELESNQSDDLNKKSKMEKNIVSKVTDKTCNMCNKEFKSRKNAFEHYRKVHSCDNYICPDCGKLLKSKNYLKVHLQSHSSKECLCEKCGKHFKTCTQVLKHMRTVHDEERKHKCSWCDKMFTDTSNKKKHESAIHLNMRNHHCHVCGFRFKNKSALNSHLYTIHTEADKKTRFECFICPKVFFSKAHLRNHATVHIDRKVFPCRHEGCVKLFRLSSNRKKHEQVHENVKPYKCEVCHQSFSRKVYLDTHQYKHTGVKQFQCSVCSKGFSQKGNLNVHMALHSKERIAHTCLFCSRSFTQKSNLAKHLLVHANSNKTTIKHSLLSDKPNITGKESVLLKNKENQSEFVGASNKQDTPRKDVPHVQGESDDIRRILIIRQVKDRFAEKNQKNKYTSSSDVLNTQINQEKMDIEDNLDTIKANLTSQNADISAEDEKSTLETDADINETVTNEFENVSGKMKSNECKEVSVEACVKEIAKVSKEKDSVGCVEMSLECNETETTEMVTGNPAQVEDNTSQSNAAVSFLNAENVNPEQTTSSTQLFLISGNAEEAQILQDFLNKCNQKQKNKANLSIYSQETTTASTKENIHEASNCMLKVEKTSQLKKTMIEKLESIQKTEITAMSCLQSTSKTPQILETKAEENTKDMQYSVVAANAITSIEKPLTIKNTVTSENIDDMDSLMEMEESGQCLDMVMTTSGPEPGIETNNKDAMMTASEHGSVSDNMDDIIAVSEPRLVTDNIDDMMTVSDNIDDMIEASEAGSMTDNLDDMMTDSEAGSDMKTLFASDDISMITVSVQGLDTIIENV